jgi:molybdopterin-binding protein
MKLSARNQLSGTVIEIKRGAVAAEVLVDIGNNVVVTSTTTVSAIDDLGIRDGSKVTVVIKASDVMIATR